jgi:cytoskeleton protein RodZ
MESDANQDTFGSYLKNFRLKQDMTIETIARKTKIAVHCLVAMEENDVGRLPPRAYVKSFIRTYADAVGANADVALDLYLSDLKRQVIAKRQRMKRQAKLGLLRRVLMAMGAIISILLLVRYSDIFPDTSPTPGDRPPPHTAVAEPLAPEAGSVRGDASADAKSTEKLKLRVLAVEKTWLKVIIDGQTVRSYTLKPEDRLELEGTKSFNLMIGNATGLQVFLNDRPVKIFGNSGQVVSLKIP